MRPVSSPPVLQRKSDAVSPDEVEVTTTVTTSPKRSASAQSAVAPPSPDENGNHAASPRKLAMHRSHSMGAPYKPAPDTADHFVQTEESHMDLMDLRDRLRSRMQSQDEIDARYAAKWAEVEAQKDEEHRADLERLREQHRADAARLASELDEAQAVIKRSEADHKAAEAKLQETANYKLKIELQKAEDQKNLVVSRLKNAIKQKLQELNQVHKAELAKQQEAWTAKLKQQAEETRVALESDMAAKLQRAEEAKSALEQEMATKLEELAAQKDAEAQELLAAREEEMREWTENYEAEQLERENAIKASYADREAKLFAKFEMLSSRNLKEALSVKDESLASMETKMKQDISKLQQKIEHLRRAFLEERTLRQEFERQLRVFVPDLASTAEVAEGGDDWMNPTPPMSARAAPADHPTAPIRPQVSTADKVWPSDAADASAARPVGGVESPGVVAGPSQSDVVSDFSDAQVKTPTDDLPVDPVALTADVSTAAANG